jgi:hypothetical protein
MRILIALVALFTVTLLAGTAFAQTCAFSGAPVGPSEARMKVRVRDSDGVLRTHYFGGPAHAFYYINDIYGDNPNIHSAFIADYGNDGQMISATDAWFLVDVDDAPYGTEADPPIVGFASQEAAQRWQGRIGGEVVQGWTNVWNWLDDQYQASGGYMGDRQRHYGREGY